MYSQHIQVTPEREYLPGWTPMQNLEGATDTRSVDQNCTEMDTGIPPPPQQRRRKHSVYSNPYPGQIDKDLAMKHVLASDVMERKAAPPGTTSTINGILLHPGLLAKHGLGDDLAERESIASDARSKKNSFLSVSSDSRSKRSSILSVSSEPRCRKNSTVSMSSEPRHKKSSAVNVPTEVRFKKNSVVSFCGLSHKDDEEDAILAQEYNQSDLSPRNSVISYGGDTAERESSSSDKRFRKRSRLSLSSLPEELTEKENNRSEQQSKRSSVNSFSGPSAKEALENDIFDDNTSFPYIHEKNGFVRSFDSLTRERFPYEMKERADNSSERKPQALIPVYSPGLPRKVDVEHGIMVKDRTSEKRLKKHSTVSFSDLPVTYSIENDTEDTEDTSPKRRRKKHSTVSFSGIPPEDDAGETATEKNGDLPEQRTRKISTVSFSGLSAKDLECDELEEGDGQNRESISPRPRKRRLSPNSNYAGLLSREASVQSLDTPKYRTTLRAITLILLGSFMIGVCSLGFYSLVEARRKGMDEAEGANEIARLPPQSSKPNVKWRSAATAENCHTDPLNTCPEYFEEPPLVVIAFDGLRPHMVNTHETPALSFLRKCGVSAESLVPSYPAETLPNLYSIATGLYPEFHGIIDNFMYDSIRNESLGVTESGREIPQWWGGEPIWRTAMGQGKKSAVNFWIGAEVLGGRDQTTYEFPFRTDKPMSVRTRQIVDWLTLPPEEVPYLTMVYYEQPMASIAKFGLNSQEAKDAIKEVDEQIDNLMYELQSEGLFHCVNFLIVSDQGAAEDGCSSSYFLETLLTDSESQARVSLELGRRFRPEEREGSAQDAFQCRSPWANALSKDLLPVRYHYAQNKRVEETLFSLKSGARAVTQDASSCKYDNSYDNVDPDMQGIFIGFGTDFRMNYTTPSFRNVELYNLMCKLLRIEPAPNNGTEGSLEHVLCQPSTTISTNDAMNILKEETHAPLKKPSRNKEYKDGVLYDSEIEPVCMCDARDPEETEEFSSTASPVIVSTTETSEILSSDRPTLHPNELNANDTEYNNNNDSFSSAVTTTATSTSTISTTTTTTTSTTTPQPLPSMTTLSSEEVYAYLSLLLNQHAPWGTPGYTSLEGNSGKVQVLLQTNYVIGLYEAIDLGLWVSFTIDHETISLVKADRPKIPKEEEDQQESQIDPRPPPCWRADPRLSRSLEDQCLRMLTTDLYQSKNISLIQLFPEELETREMSEEEGHLLSNMAPVRAGYYEARRAIINAIKCWATERLDLNVIHGPVFNHNFDGLRDSVSSSLNDFKPLVPSDYFYVVSSCRRKEKVARCSGDDLDVLAFVFPNVDLEDYCPMSDTEYLHHYLTNVRDVELLTGLLFFRSTYWNWQETLMLKAAQPFEIWPLPDTSTLKR
ncbi:venom phosphodiesterase 2-like [Macrobrachium rosenbergii]|uniref:venom phosphodiesterase 2-like n=1 Tax=Macrobrachium rosenbergii TaxID=79674 RepID=UPI0034D64164